MRRAVALVVSAALAVAIVVVTPGAASAAKPQPPASCSLAPVAGGYQLTWTAPSNTGGKPVLDYKIREKTYDNPVVTVGATVRTYTWTDAIRTQPATLTVRARNADGVGDVCTAVTSGPPPPTNQAPVVNAGVDQSVEQPDWADLDGTVTDDGLPAGSSVSVNWTKTSGPGTVTWGHSGSIDTAVGFSQSGTYVLRLTATDGTLTSFDEVTVTVTDPPVPNQAPTVSAGADSSVVYPNAAALDGTAADDGLPTGSSLTVTWTKVSGPGTVSFGDANATDTNADFSVPGTYVLQLAATDGTLTSTDTVTVTVDAPPPTNQGPTVAAGADQSVERPNAAVLDGTVSDDGLPTGSSLSTTWSQLSGPGTVTFGNASAVDTTATFSAAGSYVLRLSASDGALSSSDDLTVTVTDPPPPVESTLPCTSGSFYKDDVTDNTVSTSLTSGFHTFMATARAGETQHQVAYPRVNLNDLWSGVNHVSKAGDPVYKLTSNSGGTANTKLDILRSQGFHIPASVLALMPTGDQDRLLVVYDELFGYVAQFADAEVGANNTLTASNASIMYWDSNCLDYRNPQSDDQRNFTSRGRITPSMQMPAEWLAEAKAENRGLGYVLHWFFVENDSTFNPPWVHPMIADESGGDGWGPEGVRWRIKPSVDLVARGLTGEMLVIARTMQENGAYLGDNSGSVTQIKVGHPDQYVGTNLSTNGFAGKLSWTDFEVVTPGQQ